MKLFNGVVLGAFALTTMIGCAEDVVEISGTVVEVRITGAFVSKGSSGSPVGGAIVGGIIAGTVGAVVGAVAGSSGTDNVILQGEVVACKAFVRLLDGTLIDLTARYYEKDECSLLRQGDVLRLRSNKRRSYYRWNFTTIGTPVPQLPASTAPKDSLE